jgi:hypothetical protein
MAALLPAAAFLFPAAALLKAEKRVDPTMRYGAKVLAAAIAPPVPAAPIPEDAMIVISLCLLF